MAKKNYHEDSSAKKDTLINIMDRVTAAVIQMDGKILIARRKKGDRFEGLWEFPGGKVEPGETPEQSLKRELFEEFGVEAEVGGMFSAHIHKSPVLTIELLVFEVVVVTGSFQLREHQEIQWVRPGELTAYCFAEPDIPIVERLIKKHRVYKSREEIS